jgi:hypothetical protein
VILRHKSTALGSGALREDAEALGEVTEFGSWPQARELEEIAGDCPGYPVSPGLLGRQQFGFLQVVEGFADLPPHGVGRGEVDEAPGLPLGGKSAGVDAVGQVEGVTGVSEFDGYGDGVDRDVGGPELFASTRTASMGMRRLPTSALRPR